MDVGWRLENGCWVPAPLKNGCEMDVRFRPSGQKMDVKWMCGSGPLENGCETDVGIHPSPPHGSDMALGFVLPVRNCDCELPCLGLGPTEPGKQNSRNGLGTVVTEGFAEATSKKSPKGGWSPDDSFRALSGTI